MDHSLPETSYIRHFRSILEMPGHFIKCDGYTNIFLPLDFICAGRILSETVPQSLDAGKTQSRNNETLYFIFYNGFKQLIMT